MRKVPSPLAVVLCLVLAFTAFGCNGGTSSPLAVAVTLQPGGTQMMDEGGSLTIVATISNESSTQGVTWGLSGAGSLSNQTANTVVYLSPFVTANQTVTITATSKVTPKASATLTITVRPVPTPVISTTSLPNGTAGIPYSASLEVSGGLQPFTWSITGGSLPGWATMDTSSGWISGTPITTGTANFTVQVTDSDSPPSTATKELAITIAASDSSKNAELSGQYAFLLQGTDGSNQFAMVGSFIADGNGNITSGLEDLNGPGGPQLEVSFTGTYFVGADNRGMASFSNSMGTSITMAIAVGSLENNVATRGRLIEFDNPTTDNFGSGFLYLQESSTFNLSSIQGPFAFQLVGQTDETGARLVETGAYVADATGAVANGEVDVNLDGVMMNPVFFSGTIAAGGNTASFGRVTNTPSGIPLQFVYYIVSGQRILAMTTNPESTSGLVAGQVLAQSSTSFSVASLKGTSVGYGMGKELLSVGRWTFDGSGTASYSLTWDNLGFPNFTIHDPGTGQLSYSVLPNGRVTTSGASTTIGVPGAPIMYLVDTNEGFLMSTDSVATAGFFEPQTGGPFSNASVSGNYFFGTVAPLEEQDVSGVGTSTGNGTLNLTLDSCDWLLEGRTNQQWSYTFTIDTNGRGQVKDQFGTTVFVAYVVSPNKFVVLVRTAWPLIWIFDQ